MTIFDELSNMLIDYPKLYRVEGFNSYNFFDYKQDYKLKDNTSYIYFSRNEKHHIYYIQRKIKQFFDDYLLYETKYGINSRTVINSEAFQTIIDMLANYSMDDYLISLRFYLFPIFQTLIANNYVCNREKESKTRKPEIADKRKYSGGYGFCDEYLELLQKLTILYSYQRITKENLIEYLYAYRSKILNRAQKICPVGFLFDTSKRVTQINRNIDSPFSKYELMDCLERILANQAYCPNSFLAKNGKDGIRTILQQYCTEKDQILKVTDSIYTRKLTK